MDPEIIQPLIFMAFIIGLFYLIMFRPQQQRQKQRREMLSKLKKGHRVVTIGGIHGVIKELDDEVVSLRVADNVNLKFLRGAVDRIIDEE